MSIFFLIGGGEISNAETKSIDLKILKESSADANVLFFPTAAHDSDGYIAGFKKYYTTVGFKNIDSCKLSTDQSGEIRKKIDWSNVIYLGGGETKKLIDEFKAKKVDKLFRKKIKEEVVIAGISAGATALGEISVLSEIEDDLELGNGLSVLPKVICLPHYEERYENKLNKIKEVYPDKRVLGIPEKEVTIINGG